MSQKNIKVKKESIGSSKLKRMPTNQKGSIGPPRGEKIPSKPKPHKK